MNTETAKRVTDSNPFRARLLARLNSRGGQYRATQLNDSNQRRFFLEESGVAMMRDVKLGNLADVCEW